MIIGVLKKLSLSIASLILILIPFWIYLIVDLLLSPNGFWQNLILLGIGLWILGAIQLTLLVIWIVILMTIWW